MAYFPFFIDLSGRKCLIVGGGIVAARKLEKLSGFGAEITLVAPEICSCLARDKAVIFQRRFEDNDLDGAFAVIAATDDRQLNHHIYSLCTQRGILVNTVDDIENCGFIFPALINRGSITVGISTGGNCPAVSGYLRSMIDEKIDERIAGSAEVLSRFRPLIKTMFSSEKQRADVMKRLLNICVTSEILPDDEAIIRIMEEMKTIEDPNSNTQKQTRSGSD